MSFADFLDIMHIHSRAEDLPREVVDAFKAADPAKKGMIPARQLRHMLLHWGEQLSAKEGECQGIYYSWLSIATETGCCCKLFLCKKQTIWQTNVKQIGLRT